MKISVVLSTFNNKDFLPEAIDSILGQDAGDFELIVVDDGSTDGTGEILAGYDDIRLRVIEMPFNCGPGIARNVGVRCAKGEYLAIMDADDVAFPNRLTAQANFLDKNPEVHILGSRIIRVAESITNVIDSPNHPLDDATIKARLLLLNGTAIVHPSTMLRAEFLRDNGLDYPSDDYNEDHLFWIDCVKAGARFQTLEDTLIYKRRHGSNLTLRSEKSKERYKLKAKVELLHMYYPRLTGNEVTDLARIMRSEAALRRNQVRDGVQAGAKAIKENQSYFGESREPLNQLLSAYLASAVKALRSSAAVP